MYTNEKTRRVRKFQGKFVFKKRVRVLKHGWFYSCTYCERQTMTYICIMLFAPHLSSSIVCPCWFSVQVDCKLCIVFILVCALCVTVCVCIRLEQSLRARVSRSRAYQNNLCFVVIWLKFILNYPDLHIWNIWNAGFDGLCESECFRKRIRFVNYTVSRSVSLFCDLVTFVWNWHRRFLNVGFAPAADRTLY